MHVRDGIRRRGAGRTLGNIVLGWEVGRAVMVSANKLVDAKEGEDDGRVVCGAVGGKVGSSVGLGLVRVLEGW